MTGIFWLDWAMLAVSLFNTLLLLWLGLTVILNAERRVWGIWLSSGGLLLGAIFFISHSAILGSELSASTPGLNFWWRLGWIPVAALPFSWYLVMLWYAGYWDRSPSTARSQLYYRQRIWFVLVVSSGAVLVCLLFFANPLPSLSELISGQIEASPVIAGIPALTLAYPLYTLLCVGLSIDALRHPEVSERLMGELARYRARRWLIATSVVLLAVSLLVGWVMVWIVNNVWRGIFTNPSIVAIGWFDLAISGLVAVSVLLLGQAVVAYEVFTGKTLPCRGLALSWRRAVILASGFSVLVSASLTLKLPSIYTLLLTAILMITFLALLSWRAYAERQRLIDNLRPFVASQRIIDSLLVDGANPVDGAFPAPGHAEGADAAFRALCVNVLETRLAGLFPYGPLALLAGPPSFFPPQTPIQSPDLDLIASRLQAIPEIGLALEPGEAGDWVFAVPLWRTGGLSGIILLGQKGAGSPYTQEEIEIAQATGERLVDAQASAEMARRLVALQRQHLVAGQVADQRVRRLIHDEVLPQVHAVMLDLAGGSAVPDADGRILDSLEVIHQTLANLLRSMPVVSAPEVQADGLVSALRRTVQAEMDASFDEVLWQIDPQAEALSLALPPLIAEVVYSAAREGIRNAARHGRGEIGFAPLCLQIGLALTGEGGLRLSLTDNGVGFAAGVGEMVASQGGIWGACWENYPRGQRAGAGLAQHSDGVDRRLADVEQPARCVNLPGAGAPAHRPGGVAGPGAYKVPCLMITQA